MTNPTLEQLAQEWKSLNKEDQIPRLTSSSALNLFSKLPSKDNQHYANMLFEYELNQRLTEGGVSLENPSPEKVISAYETLANLNLEIEPIRLTTGLNSFIGPYGTGKGDSERAPLEASSKILQLFGEFPGLNTLRAYLDRIPDNFEPKSREEIGVDEHNFSLYTCFAEKVIANLDLTKRIIATQERLYKTGIKSQNPRSVCLMIPYAGFRNLAILAQTGKPWRPEFKAEAFKID